MTCDIVGDPLRPRMPNALLFQLDAFRRCAGCIYSRMQAGYGQAMPIIIAGGLEGNNWFILGWPLSSISAPIEVEAYIADQTAGAFAAFFAKTKLGHWRCSERHAAPVAAAN